MTDLPHDPYMDAVDNALIDAKIGISDGFTADGDEYDEEGATLPSAVFLWNPDHAAVDATEFEYGIGVFWNPVAGWECARLQPHGANDTPQPLGPDVWAAPEQVVAAVRDFLTLTDRGDRYDGEWEHAEAGRSAVAAWRAA